MAAVTFDVDSTRHLTNVLSAAAAATDGVARHLANGRVTSALASQSPAFKTQLRCWAQVISAGTRELEPTQYNCEAPCLIFKKKIFSTRSAWQSQTWDRPAPQVRVESQLSYSKYLPQQRYLANDPENYIIEPCGVWNCVTFQWTRT